MSSSTVFKDISQESDEPDVTVIESLCMNCHDNGCTRIMLTRIPFFRDVIVMSFSCPHCGYENNELRDAGPAQNRGVTCHLTVGGPQDLNRRVVRTEYAKVTVTELDLEIPPQSQKGEVTTIEGILDRVVRGLEQDQEKRRAEHPEDAQKIDQFISRVNNIKNVQDNGPFHLVLEDISGNSHIENPNAPHPDVACKISHFERTTEQNHLLGIFTHEEVDENASKPITNDTALLVPTTSEEHTLQDIEEGEVVSFRTNCPQCNCPCDTNMKMTDIPHFKEVLIMATVCDSCGHRTNEVKSGGGIEERGVKIEVKVNSRDDFSRDLLKSDTCWLSIPELELESGPHSLCGRFTTVEGMLAAVKEQLGLLVGDSIAVKDSHRIDSFVDRLEKVLRGDLKVTLVLDDPAGNSYVQTLNDDGTLDDGLKITRYERSYEQNEELGLNDIKTENYEQDS